MVRPLTTRARFSVFTQLPSSVTLARVLAISASAFSWAVRVSMAAHSASVTTFRAEQSRNWSMV